MHPNTFGPELRTTIKQNLYSEVHGTCSGQNGYVVAITRVIKIGTGKIQEDTGFAVFPVTFSAIVFRPFKNEILETLVTGINNVNNIFNFFINFFKIF